MSDSTLQPPEFAGIPKHIAIESLSSHFDVDRSTVNLENGYWGVMPRPVAQAYAENIAFVNRHNSVWARGAMRERPFAQEMLGARAALAAMVGCGADEVAITRSGAEALHSLIAQYRPLRSGDAIVCCDLDYDSVFDSLAQLAIRKGAVVDRFSMPEPATTDAILSAYEDALRRTPHAKLLLVTHISHRTGLVTPVREIVAMARARGVDTIVDAAHSVGLLDFRMDDLGADFVGWSVHKWTCAPLGLGAIYIRRDRLGDIAPSYDSMGLPETEIAARVPAGNSTFSVAMTIPAAVAFHNAVGAAAKERHIRSLRDRWVHAVRDLPVEIAVPDDPARYCAITSFRLPGMETYTDAERAMHHLLHRYGILSAVRTVTGMRPVLRVTPGLHTLPQECDALVEALHDMHRSGTFA